MGISVGKTPQERVYKCDEKGCKAHKRSSMPMNEALKALRDEGWYVGPQGAQIYCNEHGVKYAQEQISAAILRVLPRA